MRGLTPPAMSVERPSHPPITARKPPQRHAQRAFNLSPKPIGVFTEPQQMPTLATKIADRIRGHRHSANCGSYLLADKDGTVYVLPDQRAMTGRIVSDHPGLLVGYYAGDTRGARVRCPSADEIADDLRQHFADLAGVADHA